MNKAFSFKVISVVIPILLCIVVVLIYSLNINGEFVYDDVTYFIQNKVITSVSPFDFSTLFLTTTNLWGEVLPFRDFLYIIQYKAFKEWTTGYHIVSLFLFICSYLILFKLVHGLIKEHLTFKKSDANIIQTTWLITLFITSFFLFHPIYVESFSYIAGQKDALSLLFILLTVYCFHEAGKLKSTLILYFIVGLFFHYLAILSKFSALSSIVFIPILLFVTSKHPKKKIIIMVITWFIANIPVVFWFFHVMSLTSHNLTITESAPLLERIPRAINYIGQHFSHVFNPWPLNFGYPANINWTFDFYFLLGGLFLGLFFTLLVIKRNIFVILGFFIFVLYISTVIHIYPDIPNDKIYDRYLAVPFIGILIALIPTFYFFLSKSNGLKKITITSCFILTVALGFLTSLYVPVFKNQLTALEHSYKYFPNKKDVFFNYTNVLINKMELDKAEKIVNAKAYLVSENGEKNFMLGRIYLERRDFNKAIALFRLSSKESRESGNFNHADAPLAKVYMLLGHYNEAEQLLLNVIENSYHITTTYKAKEMLLELQQLKAQQLLQQ